MRTLLALFLSALACAQAPPSRPTDYAVLSPAEGLLTPIHNYRCLLPPTIVNADGTISTCPSVFGLLPATEEDPYAYQFVTSTAGAFTTTLGVSYRACMVTRWKTAYNGVDVEWLAQGSSIGGNGLGMNERRFGRFGTNTQEHHNPTFGGSARIPYREGPYHSAAPLHLIARPGLIEGGVIPQEFDPDGSVEGQSDHGGDATHPVLAWRERQFGRLEPNWLGRRTLHRLTWWGYNPDGWLPTEELAPVLTYLAPALHVRGRMFDQAFFLDLAAHTMEPVPFFEIPPGPIEPYHMRAETSTLGMVLDDPDGNRTNRVSPWPSGYAAILLRRVSDDFTVGVAMKIWEDPLLTTRPTQINISQNLQHVPGPTPIDVDENVVIEMVSKSGNGRVKGWIGMTYFIYTGPWSAAVATMNILKQSGFLDLRPPKGLPVLAGVLPP